jgi:hypothetical protein
MTWQVGDLARGWNPGEDSPVVLHLAPLWLLPSPVLRGLIAVVSRLPSLSHLAPEMAERMNEDLVFDASDARRDFGWDPGPFEPPSDGPLC